MLVTLIRDHPVGRAGTLQDVPPPLGQRLIEEQIAVAGDQRHQIRSHPMETADEEVPETRTRGRRKRKA